MYRIKFRKINKSSCLLLILTTLSFDVLAIQKRTLDGAIKAKVNISAHDFNRIAVIGDRIENIFGKKQKFHIEVDENQGQIFLGVKDPSIKEISLTIVTESGLTQDILMKVKDIPAETILFSSEENSLQESPRLTSLQERKHHLMKGMLKETITNDYIALSANEVVTGVPKINNKLVGTKITKQKVYILRKNLQKYQGEVYVIENLNKFDLHIKEEDFQWIKNVNLVSISSRTLNPGKSAIIYVVKEI